MKPFLPKIAVLTACLGGVLQAQEPLVMPAQGDADSNLVITLLGQNLSTRTFSFTTVLEASSGKKVLPLTGDAAHQRVTGAIGKALSAIISEAEKLDSAMRKLHDSGEITKTFQEAIRKQLDEADGIRCDIPPNRSGAQQAWGYPGLRVTDEESKIVFYLEPKLVKKDSEDGTLAFEPNNETLKVTDDAVHLLLGIEHDGKEGEWTFAGWRLVDLSKTKVKLKATFQASNSDVYQKTELSTPETPR